MLKFVWDAMSSNSVGMNFYSSKACKNNREPRIRHMHTSINGIKQFHKVIDNNSQWLWGYKSLVCFWLDNWIAWFRV